MRRIFATAMALLTLAGAAVAMATASSASTSGAACIFNAPNGVVPTFHLVGHVGWGFELPSGSWEFGANEGPGSWDVSKTWSETGSRATMLATFTKGGPDNKTGYYTQYRCATVTAFNATAAEQQVSHESHELYAVPGRDCESQAFNVLTRYGVRNMPGDIFYALPDSWFAHLPSAGFGSITHLSRMLG
jgi:hypothetical protein